MDLSEAAFIIMMSATKDMDDDVKLIMAEIKAMTAAKAELRERIKDLNEWIVDEMTRHESSQNIRNETIDSNHNMACSAAQADRSPKSSSRSRMVCRITSIA